jgi:hypothetical protein
MLTPRLARTVAVLLLLALSALVGGCSSDPSTPDPAAQAPTLPDPGRLVPDLDFFDAAATLEAAPLEKDAASKAHFVNAYLRVVVVDALTRLVLAPPVTAFAVALHTVPSPQPDGSWLWVYTWVNGDEEAQIRLRGHDAGAYVQWELRVTTEGLEPALDDVLWFEGRTAREGAEGQWSFHDHELAGNPVVAELAWGDDASGEYLTLAAVAGPDAGDTLTYRHAAPHCSVVFVDGSGDLVHDIRWNEADGSGSLQVPDYNGGERACWDTHQDDTDCD